MGIVLADLLASNVWMRGCCAMRRSIRNAKPCAFRGVGIVVIPSALYDLRMGICPTVP